MLRQEDCELEVRLGYIVIATERTGRREERRDRTKKKFQNRFEAYLIHILSSVCFNGYIIL